MDNLSDNNSSVVKTVLVGLIIECPLGGNPEDCPLHDKRELSFSDKFEWVKALTEAELLQTYSIHKQCLANKDLSAKNSQAP